MTFAGPRRTSRAMDFTLPDLDLAGLPFDDIVDVRSPAEFAEDHLPGAINLPALSDEERAIVGTIYVREDRLQGEPKMTFGKLFVLAADAIFSFSKFPIRLCLVLGMVGTVVFMLAGVYVLTAKVAGFAQPGWSSTVLSIYFLGSIQLIFLGVVGEYVYRIYKESQKRPLYFIKKIYQSEEDK